VIPLTAILPVVSRGRPPSSVQGSEKREEPYILGATFSTGYPIEPLANFLDAETNILEVSCPDPRKTRTFKN
jgi:hypothetical protein